MFAKRTRKILSARGDPIAVMNIIFVDLEWNGAPLYATGGYYNEIIEIGAVKVDENLAQIDTFQSFIRPQVHKKLTGRVKRLTHISNNEIRGAISFLAALELFRKWVGPEENCFMTWGTTDIMVWLEDLEHINRPPRLESAHYYCDAQELCRTKLEIDRRKQPGLSTVAEQIGVEFVDEEMHRAVQDCLVSLDCLRKLWDRELFDSLRTPADDEFVRKLTFKPYIISDPSNPAVDSSKFAVECPECGRLMDQVSEPKPRGKGFGMKYICAGCGKEYLVKHVFRVKYEGVEYKRNIRDLTPPPKEEAEEEPVCEDTAGDTGSEE